MSESYVHLWNGIKNGDSQSLFILYEELFPHLHNFAIKYSSDVELSRDIVNEVFFEIWDKREEIAAVNNVKSYLLTYVKRKITRYSYHQELKNKAIISQEDAHIEFSYEDIIINAQVQENNHLRLKNALSKLSKTQIDIVELKFFENFSYQEIATNRKLSVKTVYNIIYDALKILKAEFKSFSDKSSFKKRH